jgi:hypothetical protein
VNPLKLFHGLRARGVNLEAVGDNLKVDAPVGVLTEEDRAALLRFKPVLLRFLSRAQRELEDDGHRFDARPSRHPGYTSLYDPVGDEWHDFPTRDCHPSIVAMTQKARKRGGAA